MSEHQTPKYEVQYFDYNQFDPIETGAWCCAGGCATFEDALNRLSVIQHAHPGVRVVLADPKGWKEEA